MSVKFKLGAIASIALLSACATTIDPSRASVENATRFESHMNFLASDLLEGRKPGEPGHEIASNYIATQFAMYGVQPASEGSYYQSVQLETRSYVMDGRAFSIDTQSGKLDVILEENAMLYPSSRYPNAEVTGELVFAGYGISAPSLGYDDFEGIDVEGKIIVVFTGKPNWFPSAEGSHFRSMRGREWASRGVTGVIVMQTPEAEERYSFERAAARGYRDSMFWRDPQGRVLGYDSSVQATASINVEMSRALLASAGLDYDQLVETLNSGQAVKGAELPATAHMKGSSTFETITSPNVVGIIEGTDPELKDEYILLTAHSDHVGRHENDSDDEIYNGAMDNATGVTTLIEVARMFHESGERPRRSILLAAVTAEEKGLLGSAYLANNPVVPTQNIVANVNLDMPVLTFDAKELVAFGAEHSSIKPFVEPAANDAGFTLIDDPVPHMNLFVRSDHYSFVKQGVPAVFLTMNPTATSESEDEVGMADFLQHHYHQPTDDLNLPIDYNVAARFVQANYDITRALANADERVEWNDDSFFSTLRK